MFADFTGTMAGSDCFNPFVIDSDYLLSSAAPARLPGRIEALPSPDVGCTCVPGFLRQRGARQSLTITVLQVLPSADDKTSALQIISFTMLNHPGHTPRCRRFAYTLTDAPARLAVKVVVNLSSLPDLHRLPQRQLARRSPSRLTRYRRWQVEEGYKTGKDVIESFHAKSERGVRQELYAAFTLVALARLFANRCDHDINHNVGDDDDLPAMRTNFKNGMRLMGREIEAMFLRQSQMVAQSVKRIMTGLSRCIQRERPGRSYNRESRQPRSKWQNRRTA